MKLKQILNEQLIKKDVSYSNFIADETEKFDIHSFKSISFENLKVTGTATPRVVKTIDGKFLTISKQDVNEALHEDIVRILIENGFLPKTHKNNWWKDPDSLNDYICIERNKGKWFASESYSFDNVSQEEFENLVKSKYKNVSIQES